MVYTKSCKQVLRLIFNFVLSDEAMLLLGMLGDATRQSSLGKFEEDAFSIG
jgi:hypothetical protein